MKEKKNRFEAFCGNVLDFYFVDCRVTFRAVAARGNGREGERTVTHLL
jgi:hypothetical protein